MAFTEQEFIDSAKFHFALHVDNTAHLYGCMVYRIETANRYGVPSYRTALRNALHDLVNVANLHSIFDEGLTEEQIETRRKNGWSLGFAELEAAIKDSFDELWGEAWPDYPTQ